MIAHRVQHQLNETSQSDQTQIIKNLKLESLMKNVQKICLHIIMDTLIGFKIEIKFAKNYLAVKGLLIYCNGSPIKLPQLYWDSILQKLRQCYTITLHFKYTKNIDTLVFYSSLKLDNQELNHITHIEQYLNSIIQQLPQVYQKLHCFGIGKKFNQKHYKMIMKKLKLLNNVGNTFRMEETKNETSHEQITASDCSSGKKGSVFKFYKEIEQLDSKEQIKQNNINQSTLQQNKKQYYKKGGYFQIQKKKCKITRNTLEGEQQQIITELAVKMVRKDKQNLQHYQNKLSKQIRIVSQIQNPNYALTYWVKQNQCVAWINQKIYMEYVEETLNDCIYGRHNSLKDILNYSEQIICAVNLLHKSQIVHRDLKPENILVQNSKSKQSENSPKVKVIDFAEASLQKDIFNKETEDVLGSSLPYSPIQCYISCQQGFNSTKIDFWSVGLILYQIFNKRNPLTYSKCFSNQIYLGWTTSKQFSIFPNLRSKYGIQIISYVFSILTLNSVCIKQKQRINLQQMADLINFISDFLIELEEP